MPNHQVPERRSSDQTITQMQQELRQLDQQVQQLITTVHDDILPTINKQRGAFILGNILVGVLTTIVMSAVYWGVTTIGQTEQTARENQLQLIALAQRLQEHAQVEFHAGAYPAVRSIERELTALRITIERMDQEQKTRRGER